MEGSWKLASAHRAEPAGRIVPLVLGEHLATFELHEPGALAGDVEDLHQYRVTMRRTRSLLRAARRVVPDDRRRAAEAALRRMTAVTSPVRDLDVLVAELDELGATAGLTPAAVAEMAGYLDARRERSRAELSAAIGGAMRTELGRRWRAVTEVHPIAGDPPGRHALRPMGSVADRMLRDAYRRSRRRGRAALASDDLEHWHDLRKALKAYRYLLEAYGPLWDREDRRGVRRELRALQDRIGGLQDLRVHRDAMATLAAEASAAGRPRLAGAAEQLAAHLAVRTEEVRKGCAAAWESFDTEATRAAMDRLTG